MRYASLFAGIGGFDLALDRLGHFCVYANDIDRYCKLTYDKNFLQTPSPTDVSEIGGRQSTQKTEQVQTGQGLHTIPSQSSLPENRQSSEHTDRSIDTRQSSSGRTYEYKRDGLDLRDITQIPAEEIPDHDLLVGGFPCQSFSIAGKRRGFADTRGTLFYDICRILSAKRPPYLLLENVKGLLSHDSGRTFQTILRTLDELGYDLQWQVCNSKNFGVPQNRERVYIVGNSRDRSRPKIFPLTQTNPASLEYVGGILSEQSKKWLDNGKNFSRNFPQGSRVYASTGLGSTLASQAGGLGAKTGLYAVKVDYEEEQRKLSIEKVAVANTLTATSYKGPNAANRGVVVQDGKLLPRERANTLDANYYKGLYNHQARTGVMEDLGIRKLTPTECERLQGFPDGWTDGVSDTQRYKQLGNAVTVNTVYAIASHLPQTL